MHLLRNALLLTATLLVACGESTPSGLDASTQALDGSVVQVDGSLPAVDGSLPAVDGSVATPDGSVSPGPDASSSPGPDASNPNDKTPPTVVSTDPAEGDVDVPLDKKISIRFSEPVDVSKLTADDFELIEWWDGNPQGSALAGTLDTTGNPTILFIPAAPFGKGDEYRFTVKAGIVDLAGNGLRADHVFVFDAAWVDPSAMPAVASVTPADKATGVFTTSTVQLTFNKRMAQSSLVAGENVLVYPGTDSTAAITLQRDATRNPTFVYTPQQALTPNTSYTVLVKGGASGAKDEVGTTLAADFKSVFTTGAGADTGPLEVVSVTPADKATGVSQTTTVSVTFNKAVNPSKLFLSYPGTKGTFLLSKYADGSFPETGTLDFSANPTVTFTLTATKTLELERPYYLTIVGGTNGVKAATGPAMAADFKSSFTTKAPDQAEGTIADLRAANGTCAIRVKDVTMTFYRDSPNNWKGFFIQKEKTGPGIFVVTGNTKPLFPIYPDSTATGFPTADITVTKVIDFNGFKEVTAFSMTRGATTYDLKYVRENLVQVIGDEAVGEAQESEFIQVDGVLANYKPGASAENREFDLTWGTNRKLKLKVSQYGIKEPLGLVNGTKVRVTAPLQKDADGFFIKPYWFTTDEAKTAAELADPANYDLAVDIVKLAP